MIFFIIFIAYVSWYFAKWIDKREIEIIEKTGNGFEIIEFDDKYDKECSLQQSSLAEFETPGTSAIWLGINGSSSRMHLDLEQTKELVEVLNR